VYLLPAILFFFCLIITITSQGTSTFFSQVVPDKTVRSSLALLKTSMLIQLFLNVAFIAIVAFFHHWCSSKGIFQQSGEQSTKIVTITFYIFVAWIIVCNLFGTTQIFMPSDSPAWTTEAYWWVFDATPMLVCTALLHILPPAKYLRDISNRPAASATSPEGQDNDFELGQNN
jgi:RTA1 like protein